MLDDVAAASDSGSFCSWRGTRGGDGESAEDDGSESGKRRTSMARSSRCFLYDVLSVAMPSSYAWEASLLLVVCWLRRVTSSKLFANKMSDSKTLSKPKIKTQKNKRRARTA